MLITVIWIKLELICSDNIIVQIIDIKMELVSSKYGTSSVDCTCTNPVLAQY